MGRVGKVGRDNKQGGSINRGGRKNFLETIKGEALIRASRVENWSQINKQACPYIKYSRVG